MQLINLYLKGINTLPGILELHQKLWYFLFRFQTFNVQCFNVNVFFFSFFPLFLLLKLESLASDYKDIFREGL